MAFHDLASTCFSRSISCFSSSWMLCYNLDIHGCCASWRLCYINTVCVITVAILLLFLYFCFCSYTSPYSVLFYLYEKINFLISPSFKMPHHSESLLWEKKTSLYLVLVFLNFHCSLAYSVFNKLWII